MENNRTDKTIAPINICNNSFEVSFIESSFFLPVQIILKESDFLLEIKLYVFFTNQMTETPISLNKYEP